MIVKHLPRWTAGFAVALALGGCVSDDGGMPPGSSGIMNSGGPSIAFDSVDGPPPQVFERFVNALNTEAQARALPTTSRQAQAAWRVRAYLAAQTTRSRTSIAWVFDVYGSGQRRTLRLSGEEPAGRAGRDAWSGADEHLLRRIAQKGMAEIAVMMNGGASAGAIQQPSAPATPAPQGPAIANAGESTPDNDAARPDFRSALAFGTN